MTSVSVVVLVLKNGSFVSKPFRGWLVVSAGNEKKFVGVGVIGNIVEMSDCIMKVSFV